MDAHGRVRSAPLALGVLTGLNVLNYADRYVRAAMRPLILSSLVLTDAEGGLLQSAFILSYSVFSPLAWWVGRQPMGAAQARGGRRPRVERGDDRVRARADVRHAPARAHGSTLVD